jgi:serine/threonine protein kinase/Flp pilus assembly protein TadD
MTSQRRSVAPIGEEELAIADLIEEFTARLQAGESIDAEAFAAEHPSYAEKLRGLLPGVQVLAELEHSGSDADSDPVCAKSQEGPLSGVLGDFRIIREVGKGGMGVVYEAEQVSLRRRVALKVLPFAATMDPRHLQRFHNEAQAAACLHHTNIVPVHFVGCERGVHFYAMQFIDGQPLSEIIRQMRRLEKNEPTAAEDGTAAYQASPAEATSTAPAAEITPLTGEGLRNRDYYRKVAELEIQAAEALDHAHQVGIVHRDIKPGNLMLDVRGNLWVTDFGLAHMHHREASLTGTGQMVGTPRYMSPEQALAERVPIDHRTDVYSLGVTLYELLTLRPAFTSEDRNELLRQIAFEEPTKPRRLERAIPAELETIVLKAMEKRAQDRYATAQELADDLERWLKNEPIRARRPTLLQRASKWVRRHKPAATAGVVVLLMAITLAGYIGWTRHDGSVRREAIKELILAALKDSQHWQEQRRLSEALSAARRANGLLAGAEVDEASHQQVRARLAGLELLDRLENIRLEKQTIVRQEHFDHKGADTLYEKTFREAGFDMEALSAEQAAERIRDSTVAAELAAMLDDWALARRKVQGMDASSWKALLHVACLVQSDALQTRVREALKREDRQALRDLAASGEVFRLPPEMLRVLGSALMDDKENQGQVETFLRCAQRRHPDDFWLNYNLFTYYTSIIDPQQQEEAIPFAASALALRPGSPGAHLNLGLLLDEKGRLEEAIGEYREAIRLKEDYATAHSNLGVSLFKMGQLDEAIKECRKAVLLNRNVAGFHSNLGALLTEKGQLDEAIAECREAVQLEKDNDAFHKSLGNALEEGHLDEAIEEYREAIRLKKDSAENHYSLGRALHFMGRIDEAADEYQEAIRLKQDYSEAHDNLGAILCDHKHDYGKAIIEFREAIRLKKDNANAHHNLGAAFFQTGQLEGAIAEFREAIRLKKDYAEAQSHLKKALAVKEILAKLPAILSGKAKADNPAEQLALASVCQEPYKRLYAAAARFYSDAFAAQPHLADDVDAQHRYNAACVAALAGCGQGADADELDVKERTRLRRQALDWLRADLKAYRQLMEKSADKAGPAIAQRMQHWLQDGDFSGVRGAESLARLPEAERKEWHKLWQEVEALRQRAAQPPKTASSDQH